MTIALQPGTGRTVSCRRAGLWLLALLAASGCGENAPTAPSLRGPVRLHLIRPRVRKMSHVVGQPSFVQSYERTSVYPKITAFIERWNVDIGDKVKKGDVLANLFVPEIEENFRTKAAEVKLDRARVDLALKRVKVARADVKAAEARLREAKRIVGSYQAEVDRWQSEVARLKREVKRGVVAPQILLESQNQLKSDTAKLKAAEADVDKAQADLLSKEATLEEDVVDVEVARSRLAVAESEEKRLKAWVGYFKLLAPYDGIVVERNANTWDFVLPRTGDPTAMPRDPYLSPGERAAPVYVIDRTDIVRVYVDIPERDVNNVRVGSEAQVKVWAYRDEWIPASVTRVSWALNPQSRTMRAEIDLPNPGARIRPGMYAYGKVLVERPGVLALPKSAITQAGGKSFVWLYEKGHARRTEIQTGLAGDKWVEVTNRRTDSRSAFGDRWVPFDSSVAVLVGHKLSTLTEGAPVELDESPPEIESESSQSRDNAI